MISDRAKIERICGIYGGLMYKTAFGILKNRQAAEDAAEEALFKLLRMLDGMDEECWETAGYKSLAAAAARHTAVWRRRKRHSLTNA